MQTDILLDPIDLPEYATVDTEKGENITDNPIGGLNPGGPSIDIDIPINPDIKVPDVIPVWKDTFYTADIDELRYSINIGGEPIFHAKAYRMPGEELLKININKVCSNYLGADISELMEYMRDNGTFIDDYDISGNIKTFTITDENNVILGTYTFVNDWSYERGENMESNVRSIPINGHYAENMYTLISNMSDGEMILNSGSPAYKTLVCGSRYALYYENAYGGFDSFLIEGKVVHKDSITSHNYSRSFVNTSVSHEMKRYIDEIQGSYELHTGFLTDSQSENLVKHLLTSNQVYMHDLKTGDIQPVVLTNKDVEYLNYKNNKMFSYTINVTVSQNRIRK